MLKMCPEKSLEKENSKILEKTNFSPNFEIGEGKIHFISLGCPRNLVDTEVMLGILLKTGYEITELLEEADYIIINTCGFLEASRKESLEVIEESLQYRKSKAKLIVAGCMVQKYSEQIKQEFPEVDYFLGSGDVEGILQAVTSVHQGEQITSARSYLEVGEIPRQISTPHHYAYLKIAEGCRKRCAYCMIPEIKGPLKSKPMDRILKEFRALRASGVEEIILIAQDLGDWGKERGYRRSEGLIHVLKTLLQEDGDFWLRLLYLYPDEMTDELIEVIKSDSRICPYIDMPIQHVNNEILRSMRRTTNKEQIVQVISSLRRAIPEVSIRTSLIVGYPGETEEQFEELVEFVKEYVLDAVGIFKYSQEEGSLAATLPNQVDEKTKERRYAELMQVQQKVLDVQLKKQIGKQFLVFVEGYHSESELLMRGRHQGQAPEIDGEIIINDGRLVEEFGKRYLVEITDTSGYDLIGRGIKSF